MTGIILKNHKDAVIDIKQDEAKKEVVVTFKRTQSDPAPYVATWNMDKAKSLGLAGKANYQSQPLTMLRARALSEGYRVKFGDTLLGFYSTEEMEDAPAFRNDPLIDIQQAAREDAERMRLEQTPKEELEIGPLYRIMNGKFRSKQLFQITTDELEKYLNELNKREKKPWERDLSSVISNYLENIEMYRDMILDLINEN
jgi:hypothetical protein